MLHVLILIWNIRLGFIIYSRSLCFNQTLTSPAKEKKMVQFIRIELTDDIQDKITKISDESTADSKVYVLFFGKEFNA